MYSALLATSTRGITTRQRKLVPKVCPSKSDTKLNYTSFGVFLQENYAVESKEHNNSREVFAALRRKFSALPKADLGKYQAISQRNSETLARRATIFKEARTNPYLLFHKQMYSQVAAEVKGKGLQKGVEIAKILSKRWKALHPVERSTFLARAAKRRSEAVERCREMIAHASSAHV